MSEFNIAALSPPYCEAKRLCSEVVPLGGILVVPSSERFGLCVAAHGRNLHPWCPAVVFCRSAFTYNRILPLVDQSSSIILWDESHLVPTPGGAAERHVVEAVRTRSGPSRAAVAAYVATRCNGEAPRVALQCALGVAPPGTVLHRSSVARALRGIAPVDLRAWGSLWKFAQIAQRCAGRGMRHGIDRAAFDLDVSPRSFRAWLDGIACSWEVFQSRVGWEWVVESWLRSNGGPQFDAACKEGRDWTPM